MAKGKGLYRRLIALYLCAALSCGSELKAAAGDSRCLDSLTAGAASVLEENAPVSENDGQEAERGGQEPEDAAEADAEDIAREAVQQGVSVAQESLAEQQEAARKAEQEKKAQAEREAREKAAAEPADGGKTGSIVMADVNNFINVRADASEDAERVGYLYADCGGRILERKNGWTKLQSGDVVGWASDEYLLFGEEAEELAGSVGNLIVTIETDALRVRKEPSQSAGVLGVIARDDELDVVEELDGWICIQYGSQTGYVSDEFVNADFRIDTGETVEAVKAREQAEAEKRAKQKEQEKAQAKAAQPQTQGAQPVENRGAVAADVTDEALLGALIQCEAGNQPYEGQLAVGAVVMNRLRSGGYPNTLSGVIYASGQFGPARTGKLDRVLASGNIKAECLQAARESLAGASNVGGATHFNRAGKRDGIVIGSHVFW